MTMLATRADLAREASDRVEARECAARNRKLAAQRQFELAVDAEVQASIETIYEERCAEIIAEATAAGARHATVNIPTNFGDEEPIRPEYWRKPGVRCKAIVKHLSAYLKKEDFVVTEGAQYSDRTLRGGKQVGRTIHAIPLIISW